MPQPAPPSPPPDSPPSDPHDPSRAPADPERDAAETRLKKLIKDTFLEVIAEHNAAPPKTKTKVDILDMLFKSSEK